MKIFTKKGILQKIIVSIMIMLSFNFITPTYSRADIGGILLSPIVDLIASLGDIVINLVQGVMTREWVGTESASLQAFLMSSKDYFATYGTQATGNPRTDGGTVNVDEFDKGWLGLSDDFHIPVSTYSPEQIFAGNVAGLDINFISPNNERFGYDDKGEPLSSAGQLQDTIAQWYVALRNLAVVGLLSVLVYVGIRMILSSTSGDKAKYKQMFQDWLIALCLVFFLHYIMSFVLTMTESICDAIGGDGSDTIKITLEGGDVDGNSFTTNLLGEARFKTQYADLGTKVTYLILYIILVGYTCVFTWMYLKRLLMMAFLTIIAPLVALTYPIDKLSDGTAQAFNAWLKEYVYNALLQPFHLIIYTVLVSSAMGLAESNILYTIAAIGFLIPAEKILRNIFGFNKAGAGTVGALTGAAVAGTVASKLFNKAGSKVSGGKDGGGSGNNSSGDAEKPPRFSGNGELNSIADEAGDGTPGTESQGTNGENAEEGVNRRLDQGQDGGTGNPQNQQGGNASGSGTPTDTGDGSPQGIGTGNADTGGTDNTDNNATGNSRRNIRTQNQDEDQNKKSVKRGFGRVFHPKKGTHRKLMQLKQQPVKTIAGAVGKGLWGAGKKTLKLATRTATRTATTAAGALVGGTVGLVGGIIAGNGVTGMVAGATAGAGFGNKVGGRISQGIEKGVGNVARNTATRFKQGYYGDKEYAKKQRLEEFQNSDENWEFARQQAKAILQANGELKENELPTSAQVQEQMDRMSNYVDKGYTNPEEIAKLQRAEQFGYDSKESARAAAYAKKAGYTVDDKTVDQTRNAMVDDFRNANKNLSIQQAEAMADRQIDILRRQQGYGSVKRPSNTNRQPAPANNANNNGNNNPSQSNNSNNNGNNNPSQSNNSNNNGNNNPSQSNN